MIQDIYPYKFDNHFRPGQCPAAGDIIFSFSGSSLLCRTEEGFVSFPRFEDCTLSENPVYLFSIDEERFFLNRSPGFAPPAGFEYQSLKSLRKKGAAPKHLIFAAITADHLNRWYTSNRFCGRCGKPLKESESERALLCTGCGRTVYPRINPAVIVGVADGDNLLLTKYASGDLPYYALIAGFAEIGESLEETVKREVREEVGLEVKNIRYYKSQPWGFADDILAGYFCEVSGDPEIKMDTRELKEAVWMPAKDVPGQSDDFSLTNEMMMAFKNGLVRFA